ncbi:hypothetical protein T05_9876 [Trichinella murrelli]|uniref:Uncharacterized protein n=1 Tax=Trichinella murrelli TaxID=144512 RepID=A0A0V0U0J6_9BILA|nr:hypothetical protein T05_9876 [Trichinella murrelli]
MSVQVSSADTDDSKDDAEDKECIQMGVQVRSAGTDDSKNDTEDYVYRYRKSVKQPGATPAAKFLKNRKFLKKRLRHSPRRSLRA